jgi:predicted flap endonuclease-1-like 5' DNA nuclease
MTELLWQAWLLLAAAFFLGAVVACGLKRRFYYRSGRGADAAVSGIPHAPAPGEPKVEVAPRAAAEGERFNRAISGQSAVPSAATAAAPAVAATAVAAASAKPAPAPTPVAAPAPVAPAAPAGPVGDDFTRIRSIDAKIRKLLNDAGITKFTQLAALTASEASALADKIGLRGRVEQENWIPQAQVLAAGGETYYARRVDRGQPVPTVLVSPRALEPAKAATQIVASSLPLAFGNEGDQDNLTRIRGIDGAVQAKLAELGVRRYAHLAALTPPDIKAINGALGFYGRIERENWIGQAAILAAGGETYYSRRLYVAAGSPTAAAAAAPAPAPVAAPVASAAPASPAAPTAPAPVTPPPATAVNYTPPTIDPPPAEFTQISRPLSPSAAADVAALRSVRSEALVGPDAVLSDRRDADDLKRIRGIGVLIEKKLNSLGILHYEQVANWTGADIERISSLLDFKGRIEREAWIEQARILATGGQTEFSRRNDA